MKMKSGLFRPMLCIKGLIGFWFRLDQSRIAQWKHQAKAEQIMCVSNKVLTIKTKLLNLILGSKSLKSHSTLTAV